MNLRNWKGDKIGYNGLHIWVRKKLGKANHCEVCGLKKVPNREKQYFEWANLSHKYKRDLTDFKQMCIPCHRKYDGDYRKVLRELKKQKGWSYVYVERKVVFN